MSTLTPISRSIIQEMVPSKKYNHQALNKKLFTVHMEQFANWQWMSRSQWRDLENTKKKKKSKKRRLLTAVPICVVT